MQPSEHRPRVRSDLTVGVTGTVTAQMLSAFALTILLVTLWAVTHRYKGLSGDAELYAVQALARIHAGLANDLFLRYGSQDKYTFFSAIYAQCINFLGLQSAALYLALIFKGWLLVAAWSLACSMSNGRVASVAVALLIIVAGTYGGFGVFQYAEDWLTARSMAEALTISAIALFFCDRRLTGVLMTASAFLIHPIMALPGLLILLCMWISLRVQLAAAALGTLVFFGVSLWGHYSLSSAGIFAVIDPPWLEVVLERSVFLFPHLWRFEDWENTCRPLLCLTVAALALNDTNTRSLCIAAIIVGATGVFIALTAGLVGHVALLVQAQTWRWMWISSFLGVLLTALAAAKIYRDPRCGPITSMLLIAGWTFAPVHGIACVAVALFIWLTREKIDERSSSHLRWGAGALGAIMLVWVAFNSWNILVTPDVESGRDALVVARIRNILELQVPAFGLVLLLAYWISIIRSVAILTAMVTCISYCCAMVMPGALKDLLREGSATEIDEFVDWRKAIPAAGVVYVAPVHYSAAFAWFTLERPSYLTVDQSAGVVFSRATAMEIKRRSQVLLPMLDPDWRLRTAVDARSAGRGVTQHRSRSLTKERLASVCRDRQLGFVVARENVGFDPVTHKHPGEWQDWNLYDCNRVRSAESGS